MIIDVEKWLITIEGRKYLILHVGDSTMAANSPIQDTPKMREVSKMMVGDIQSRKLFGKRQYYATWERIVFFQNYKEKRIDSIQLKLDTDLVLNGALFYELLNCIQHPKPTSGEEFELDKDKYEPLNFRNFIKDILPGKHYLKHIEKTEKEKRKAQEKKLYRSHNLIYEKFTGTGQFEDPLKGDIKTQTDTINARLNGKFSFKHKVVGISYRPASDNEPQYINLEIKFFDEISNPIKVTFRSKSGRANDPNKEQHPNKEIVLNLHLYNEADISTCPNAKIISDNQGFSVEIIERLTEFFSSFLSCSEWLNEPLDASKTLNYLPEKIPLYRRVVEHGQPPRFYVRPSDKQQRYKLILEPNLSLKQLAQVLTANPLNIYVRQNRNGTLSFTMSGWVDYSGEQQFVPIKYPFIDGIPPILDQIFLDEKKESIFAWMANPRNGDRRYIPRQVYTPERSPEVSPLVIPLDAPIGEFEELSLLEKKVLPPQNQASSNGSQPSSSSSSSSFGAISPIRGNPYASFTTPPSSPQKDSNGSEDVATKTLTLS